MALKKCSTCTTAYAHTLDKCPQCTGNEWEWAHVEDGGATKDQAPQPTSMKAKAVPVQRAQKD